MNPTHDSDVGLDAALRTLDAAPARPLDHSDRVRLDEALNRILAQDRQPPSRADRDPLLPRTRLPVSTLGLAAGVAAVAVVASQTIGGATAYADSWTPVPTVASSADTHAAVRECLEKENWLTSDAVARLEPRLAERRGDLVLVALDDGAANRTVLTCIVALPIGGDPEFVASGGGGGSRPPAGSITDGALFVQQTLGDELSVLDGLVGEDVAAVTVRTADGSAVQATVQGGHYAAWWPGLAMATSATWNPRGVENDCEGACPDRYLVPMYTLDITLDDGTVLTDVSGRSM